MSCILIIESAYKNIDEQGSYYFIYFKSINGVRVTSKILLKEEKKKIIIIDNILRKYNVLLCLFFLFFYFNGRSLCIGIVSFIIKKF